MAPEAFERLYAMHAKPLLAFLVYRTGDVAFAEDILADTFERALKSGRSYDPRRGRQKTWLYSIALNRLSDLQRRKSAEHRALEQVTATTGAAYDSHAESLEERDALSSALASLSDEELEAIALRYGADLTIREVAIVSRTGTTTVKARIHGALMKLRDELGQADVS